MQQCLVLSQDDLLQIYNEALMYYKDDNIKGLNDREFVCKSYIKAVTGFLNRNGFDVSIEFQDKNFNTVD